jgi:glycosyltransferase 2 family protein
VAEPRLPRANTSVQSFNRRLLLNLPRLRNGLRWPVLGIAVFIVLSSLRRHWSAIQQLRPDPDTIPLLLFGLGLLLLEHILQGWAWGRLVTVLGQPLQPIAAIQLFLKSRGWRYRVGSFDGQVPLLSASVSPGQSALPLSAAIQLGTYLLAVLAIALLGLADDRWWLELLLVPLAVFLLTPSALRQCLRRGSGDRLRVLTRLGHNTTDVSCTLGAYPWLSPIAGLLLLLLRTVSLGCGMAIVLPLQAGDAWSLLGAVSGATLAGIVLPGGPAALGVFDAALILLLYAFPAPAGLAAVIVYRVLWLLADGLATVVASADQGLDHFLFNQGPVLNKAPEPVEGQSSDEPI